MLAHDRALTAILACSLLAAGCKNETAAPAAKAVDGSSPPTEAGVARPPLESDPLPPPWKGSDIPPDRGITQIRHVVVLVKENRTFDHYFTGFPGAESSLTAKLPDGGTLDRPIAPNKALACDPPHGFPTARAAYHGGKMDNFVGNADCSDPMVPYYRFTEEQIPNYWAYAKNFVLCDHFFSTLMTSTTPGHFSTVAGQAPFFANTPSVAGCTIPPSQRSPVEAFNRDTCEPRGTVDPCFDVPSIVDEFPGALTWRAYGYADKDGRVSTPFNLIERVGSNPETRSQHYRPTAELLADLDKGELPNLIYANIAAPDDLSEHPPVFPCKGENFSVEIINRIMKSPKWNQTAILLTYDDWGGFYDHVTPELARCQYGLGFRLPATIISPYAKKGFILKDVVEHASIPRFIEDVFGMPRMATRDPHARDAVAGSLLGAFDFTQSPREPMVLTPRACP